MSANKSDLSHSAWIVGVLILAGLFLLLNSAGLTHADPDTLFASAIGAGTTCAQDQPCGLHTALSQATGGDTIIISGGTYKGSGSNVLNITRGVSLYGGWNGAATGPVVRDPAAYPTIVDGENARRVVYVSGNISPTLDGLWLTNGSTSGDGGGLYVAQAQPTVNNCRILGNTAGFSGGGVYINNSVSASLAGNEIYDNTASTYSGGGIYLRNDPGANLSHNEVYGNSAKGGGGGVYLDNCDDAALTHNKVLTNTSETYGGGVILVGSDGPRLAYNRFAANMAENQGGGLYINHSSNVTLMGNVIDSNLSQSSGGGVSIYVQSDNARLSANLISNNTAAGEGAGIYVADSANATLINNMIVENTLTGSSRNGAGIYANDAGVHLFHSTLARNGGGRGQGIALQNGATAWLTNTILVSHTVGIQVDAGTAATLTATLWGDGLWANVDDTVGSGSILTGTQNTWDDPVFVDAAGSDYHIGLGSAAIDKGITVPVKTDIDRQPRPYQDHDLGADEFWPPGVLKRVYLPFVIK